MRRLAVLFAALVFVTAGVAAAADTGNVRVLPDKGTYVGDGAYDGREGGENFGDALAITSLPYSDSGATCDNLNDITVSCISTTAPEVVYSFVPAENMNVTVSLCGSSYDTQLGIFDAGYNEIACNDDYCGTQSEIQNFPLVGGNTYYFVVDGYSSYCGSYVINVTRVIPVELECPAGALLEGEPICYDYYYDGYNGGCNSVGWTVICPQAADAALLCGTSGTYIGTSGGSTRDTDWFKVWGTGATMTATVTAEFAVQLIFIYSTACPVTSGYDIATGAAGAPVSLSRVVGAGTEAWIWVGPQTYSGVVCGADYILEMTGIQAHTPECVPSPTETKSWGAIKSLYR